MAYGLEFLILTVSKKVTFFYTQYSITSRKMRKFVAVSVRSFVAKKSFLAKRVTN